MTAAFESLGTVADALGPIGDDGTVWAVEPDPTNDFATTTIQETPGSSKAQPWKVVGTNVFVRPGFVAYTPGDNLEGNPKIFFPEAGQSLTFPNVSGQPMLSGYQRANDQILISTAGVVIEVIPPSS